MSARKRYRPAPKFVNAVDIAIQRARKIGVDERRDLLRPVHEGIADLSSGRGREGSWTDLADAFNIAEALVELHIAGNLGDTVREAQAALASVMERYQKRRAWGVSATELAALREGAWLYGVQLEHCSAGEHLRAIQMVRNRIGAALAGNAGPGTRVHRIDPEARP